MRTGLFIPISNNALAIALFIGIAFLVIAGIFKAIQKASFIERESIKFSEPSPTSTEKISLFESNLGPLPGVDFSTLVIPITQQASSFFSQLAPHAGLNIDINRSKNTLLFSNSESKKHRLVIAITGSGRYATAYYSTQLKSLTFEPRLLFKANEKSFVFKSSAESLIFKDESESFYEISLSALNAFTSENNGRFSVGFNEFLSEIEGGELRKMQNMVKLITLIAKVRSDIIFLGD